MRAQATLRNISSERCRQIIIRNLARIMDIRIVDLDLDSRLLTFLYARPSALRKVRQELERIGFPIRSMNQKHAPVATKSLQMYSSVGKRQQGRKLNTAVTP